MPLVYLLEEKNIDEIKLKKLNPYFFELSLTAFQLHETAFRRLKLFFIGHCDKFRYYLMWTSAYLC
jgi:hypothetical protein